MLDSEDKLRVCDVAVGQQAGVATFSSRPEQAGLDCLSVTVRSSSRQIYWPSFIKQVPEDLAAASSSTQDKRTRGRH